MNVMCENSKITFTIDLVDNNLINYYNSLENQWKIPDLIRCTQMYRYIVLSSLHRNNIRFATEYYYFRGRHNICKLLPGL